MDHADAARAARVLDAAGGSDLGAALDDLVLAHAPADMTCIFAFHPDRAPVVIHDGYSAEVSRAALSSYLRGGYLLDPFYVAAVSGGEPGLHRMGELAPDAYFDSDFAGSVDVHPCISDQAGTLVEEVGYVLPLGEDWHAVFSLMRNRLSQTFTEEEVAALRDLTPLVHAALRRHRPGDVLRDGGEPGVETALVGAFRSRLTPAQFRVVAMILRGHSGRSIAAELCITEGTVKLHRHNAYQRLGISSQSDLFGLFLEHLAQL